MTSHTYSDLFSIRVAREDDLPYICLISDDVMMPLIESIEHTYVAVNDDDVPVGFTRIKLVEQECGNDVKADSGKEPEDRHGTPRLACSSVPYVYPVAVLRSWQGYGVGAALIAHTLERYRELRLVACTPSRGFYERLDFQKIPWEEIAPEIASDCDQCPHTSTCTPQPFLKQSKECR